MPDAHRSFSSTCIVLKRVNSGETDRIVTLLSRDYGKIVTVAKGVRSMRSSQRSYLEPGNVISGFFIATKSLCLLTQTKIVESLTAQDASLAQMRRLFQVLEIVDRLFVEEMAEPELFDQVRGILRCVRSHDGFAGIQSQLADIIAQLGFQPMADTNHTSIAEYVAALTDKSMKSWQYLQVSSS